MAPISILKDFMDHELAGLADCPGMRFSIPQIKCYETAFDKPSLDHYLAGLADCSRMRFYIPQIKALDTFNTAVVSPIYYAMLLQMMLSFDPKDRPSSEEVGLTLKFSPSPLLSLADPYFKGLAKLEREPSCQSISKFEFEFEKRMVTKENIQELIFWEILEYDPQLLKDYMARNENTSFQLPMQFAYFEDNGGKGGPAVPPERKHASLSRYIKILTNGGTVGGLSIATWLTEFMFLTYALELGLLDGLEVRVESRDIVKIENNLAVRPYDAKPVKIGTLKFQQTMLEMLPLRTADATYSKIKGMLSTLGDPFTRIISPKEYQSLRIGSDGNVQGAAAKKRSRRRLTETWEYHMKSEEDPTLVDLEEVVELTGPADSRTVWLSAL
ncbi:hypothetical protein Tco_1082623 [Tanacetum coccineum]|uniref:Uncharacterized protein n=1 Tax=Tanacetum coccineum TaxID=301880 RepID=A0ABQ5I167_9ASTR